MAVEYRIYDYTRARTKRHPSGKVELITPTLEVTVAVKSSLGEALKAAKIYAATDPYWSKALQVSIGNPFKLRVAELRQTRMGRSILLHNFHRQLEVWRVEV